VILTFASWNQIGPASYYRPRGARLESRRGKDGNVKRPYGPSPARIA
jgi:hypothetical protein